MRKCCPALILIILLVTASTALARNQPPVANAGPDVNAYTASTAYLRGSAIDPDGDAIILWSWVVVSSPVGAFFFLDYPDQPTSQLQAFSPGDYVLALAVLDANYNASLPDSVNVHVADNIPPVAIATADNDTIPVGGTVCFDGSQSLDPEGGPLSYIWDFGDGSPPVFGQVSVCHSFSYPGSFAAGVQVTDERGAYDFEFITITVTSTSGVNDIPPARFARDTSRPNPFSTSTVVGFELPHSARMRLTVFDTAGRSVRVLVDEDRPAGRHAVVWDGTDGKGARVASGVYFFRMEAGKFRQTRRVAFLG